MPCSRSLTCVVNLAGKALLGPAIHQVSRLRDHIERLDDGSVTAIDDLAVVLRLLICDGKGNDLLGRLIRSYRVSPPPIWASGEASNDSGRQLTLGSLPTLRSAAQMTGGRDVPLSKLLGMRLYKTNGTAYTWRKFLQTYAEKWGGAHLDSLVPDDLAVLDVHTVGRLSLPGYMLRCAAVATWETAQEVFREIKPVELPQGINAEDETFTAPGGVGGGPRPGESLSHLLTLSQNHEDAEAVWLIDGRRPQVCGTLRLGGLSREFVYAPQAASSDTPADPSEPLVRPREPSYKTS